MEVQLSHEPNPRQAKNCQRVEITGRGRGPVVRGEGCSADFYCALDQAVARLEARLRRAHDRRRVSHGRRVPVSVARATGTITVTEELEGTAGATTDLLEPAEPATNGHSHGRDWGVDVPEAREPEDDAAEDGRQDGGERRPGRVVRTKEHHAVPMSVDDALSQMELVGHDFFLFADAATGRPSVVYRRHGYDYGVIALA
jgi:ribosome-associated translation inhibitor RaiA